MEEVESSRVTKSYDGRGSLARTRPDGAGRVVGSISITMSLDDADASILTSVAYGADGKQLWTVSLVTPSASAGT